MGNSNSTTNSKNDHSRLYRMVRTKSWDKAERFFQLAGIEEKLRNLRYLRRKTLPSGETRYTPVLSLAIALGAPIGLIREMILVGGKRVVMMTDSKGNTALHMACQYESPAPIVNLLIDVGGRELVGAKSSSNSTALIWICNAGMVVKMRLNDGKGLVPLKKKSALDKHSVAEIVNRMVDIGGRELVMTKDSRNQTALMYAITAPGVPDEAVIKLVRVGGKQLLMITNNNRATVLHIALWRQNNNDKQCSERTFKTKAIREMIDVGGVDLVTARAYFLGLTPLHVACSFGAPPDVIQYLVDAGRGAGLVTMTSTNEADQSFTALRFAIRPDDEICPDTVRILAKAGGPELILSRGGDGKTVLDVLSSTNTDGKKGEVLQPNRDEARRILEDVMRSLDARSNKSSLTIASITAVPLPMTMSGTYGDDNTSIAFAAATPLPS